MKDNMTQKVFGQLKSIALLVGVFIITVSVTSAFGPNTASTPAPSLAGNPELSAPLSKNPISQHKWNDKCPTICNVWLDSQGNGDSATAQALLGLTPSDRNYSTTTQNARPKEAVLNEKTISFGDILTKKTLTSINLTPFFEANVRDLNKTGGASWSQGAGAFDLYGYDEPASADVILLAAGNDTSPLSLSNPTPNEMTNIVLKRGSPTAPMPRFTVESVGFFGNDPVGEPIFAAVRAASVFADRAILGNNIGDKINDSDNSKNNGQFDLNVEGTTNIGYGDTCQLYGYGRVASGCPDGWMMIGYESNCHAKCRQVTTAKPLASLLVEGGRCPSLAAPTGTGYLTDTAAPFDGPLVNSVDDFPGVKLTAAERLRCGLSPICSDGVDNDGDGYIDYPNDPGCTSATDNDEFNPPTYNIYDQGMIVYPGGTYRTTSGTATVPSGRFAAQICTQNPVASDQNLKIGISVEEEYDPSVCVHFGLGPYPCGSSTSSVSNVTATIKAGQKCSVGVLYKLDRYVHGDIPQQTYISNIQIVPAAQTAHTVPPSGAAGRYFDGLDSTSYAGGTVSVTGTTGGNGAGGTLSVEPGFTGFP